jgi:hypothetical protein
VKTHTLAPIEGPQRNYRGSKANGRLRDEHQSLPLHLVREIARAWHPQPCEEATG